MWCSNPSIPPPPSAETDSHSQLIGSTASLTRVVNSDNQSSSLSGDLSGFYRLVNSRLLQLEDRLTNLSGVVDGIIHKSLIDLSDKLLVVTQLVDSRLAVQATRVGGTQDH